MGKDFHVECWGLHSFSWSPPLHGVRTCCEIYIIQPKQWNSFCLLMAFEDVEKCPHLIRGRKFQTVHFFYWIWCQNYGASFIHAIWISKLEWWPNRLAPLWSPAAGYQEDWNSLLGTGHMSPKSKFRIQNNLSINWILVETSPDPPPFFLRWQFHLGLSY